MLFERAQLLSCRFLQSMLQVFWLADGMLKQKKRLVNAFTCRALFRREFQTPVAIAQLMDCRVAAKGGNSYHQEWFRRLQRWASSKGA
jgi:hypothetical protein